MQRRFRLPLREIREALRADFCVTFARDSRIHRIYAAIRTHVCIIRVSTSEFHARVSPFCRRTSPTARMFRSDPRAVCLAQRRALIRGVGAAAAPRRPATAPRALPQLTSLCTTKTPNWRMMRHHLQRWRVPTNSNQLIAIF